MLLAAINLISDLTCCDVRSTLLSGLVVLLRPTKDDVQQHQNHDGNNLVYYVFSKRCCFFG